MPIVFSYLNTTKTKFPVINVSAAKFGRFNFGLKQIAGTTVPLHVELTFLVVFL